MANPVHINIYSLILLIGAFQGVFFAVLLFFKNRQRRSINQHLSFLIASFGLSLFHLFLIESGYIHQLKFLVGIAIPLDVIAGPALYCYIRAITRPDLNNLNSVLFRNYAVFLLSIVITIPYFQLDFESKLRLIEGGFAIKAWPDNLHTNLYMLMGLSALSFTVYLFLSARMLIQHKKRIRNFFSYREKVTLSWLTNLLIGAGLFWGVAFAYFAVLDNIEISRQALKYLGYLTTAAVFYIGTMGLMQHRIYRRLDTSFVEPEELPTPELITNDTKKYQKSALSNQDMQRIANKISQLMTEQELFLEPDLTMPKLAASLTVSPNYLSQTLNVLFKESFFDFINRQRIDYAKIQLSDKSRLNTSVLDIAMESAFNSKSAFYSAFKKHSGMTPLQFRLSQNLG